MQEGGAGAGGRVQQAPGNEVRRVARPRMRGFTLGGFRFRFGIVFHTVHQVPQVPQVPQQPAQAGEARERQYYNFQSTSSDSPQETERQEPEEDNLQLRR